MKCPIENCDSEFTRAYELTMHTRNEHNCEPTPEKPPKKTAKPKPERKKAVKKTQQLIYVLPGPVTGDPFQEDTNIGSIDSITEHNYQVKPANIDIEASNNPKFVYVLENENLDTVLEAADAIQVRISNFNVQIICVLIIKFLISLAAHEYKWN